MNTPFFGMILYYAQWVFLLSAGLGFIYCVIRLSQGGRNYYSDDGEEGDEYDEEEEALLGGIRASRSGGDGGD